MIRSPLLPIAIGVVIAAGHTTARADQLRHPAGFAFELPNIGAPWAQETRGDVLYVANDTDKVPEVELFVFPARSSGAPADIAQRIADEVVRPGVQLFTGSVKIARLVGATAKETIADAAAVTGELVINGHDRAAFAVVQRAGRSVIVLAVPDAGIYERGASNFRAMLHGLVVASAGKAGPGTSQSPARTVAPRLPELVAIREVTATSTFADKKDLYAAWRTVDYDATYDETSQTVIPTTAWCEGKPDEGIGEGLTIAFAAPTRIDVMHLAAGVWKTPALFKANNQITALEVSVDGVPTTAKPAAKRAWLDLPIGRAVSSITMKIREVAKGRMNDTCISGIWFERKAGHIVPVVGIDAAAVAALPAALVAIDDAFRKPALEHLLDFPFAFRPGTGRGTHATRKAFANWKALEAACRAQDAAEAKGTFRDDQATCPDGIAFEPGDARDVVASNPAPGTLELVFPGKHEYRDVWRLRWHDGAWHLSAIDYTE